MGHVGRRGDRFQVGYAVVGLDAVEVVDLKTRVYRAASPFPYDAVRQDCSLRAPVLGKAELDLDVSPGVEAAERLTPGTIDPAEVGIYGPDPFGEQLLGDDVVDAN